VPPPEIDAVWNLHTALTTIEITLEEMGPRGLRGYGEVGPDTEAGIATLLAEIRAAVGEFRRRYKRPVVNPRLERPLVWAKSAATRPVQLFSRPLPRAAAAKQTARRTARPELAALRRCDTQLICVWFQLQQETIPTSSLDERSFTAAQSPLSVKSACAAPRFTGVGKSALIAEFARSHPILLSPACGHLGDLVGLWRQLSGLNVTT